MCDDDDIWCEIQELCTDDGDVISGYSVYPDDEIAYLAKGDLSRLTNADLRRLNYLLVREALVEAKFGLPSSTSECEFDEYLSSWLTSLVDIGLNPINVSKMRKEQWTFSLADHISKLKQPTPILLSPDQPSINSTTLDNRITRLNHPCFGSGVLGTVQPPRQLSAGFHQVFPILVQLGVMKEGELIGVENPEVHLHPSLQVRVAEMLISHALSGRRIIVETHSDLVIRRAIRAVLEEQIAQSQIQIYFVELADSIAVPFSGVTVSFRGSSLSRVRMDERGRIANWPSGFLDDDIRESQRLMEIMYGDLAQEGENDEPS